VDDYKKVRGFWIGRIAGSDLAAPLEFDHVSTFDKDIAVSANRMPSFVIVSIRTA
jgi:hypothetical protein